MTGTPLILGHRGASAVAPENTLVAFSQAMQDGADGIEFDVRLSSDHVPVVIHDASLKRTGSRNVLVNQLTASELQEIDVGSWFNEKPATLKQSPQADYSDERVPTLAQVFELFSASNGLLYVEMKCRPDDGTALANRVVKAIHEARVSDRVVVESFALAAIAEVKRVDKRIRTSALFEPKSLHPFTILRKLQMLELARRYLANELALHHALATRRLVEAARSAGLETVIWTVDNPAWIDRARLLGVKALIANNPAAMVVHRNAVENSEPIS
jgi:glycerophosphoryl diester phosphodiesterase